MGLGKGQILPINALSRSSNVTLDRKIAEIQNREVKGVIDRIKVAIEFYDLTATDLFDGAVKKKAAAKKAPAVNSTEPAKKKELSSFFLPKARGAKPKSKPKAAAAKKENGHPLLGKPKRVKCADKNGNKWAGGSMPVWLREQVKNGRALDEFLVKNAA